MQVSISSWVGWSSLLCLSLFMSSLQAMDLAPEALIEASQKAYEERARRLFSLVRSAPLPEAQDDNDDPADNPHLDSRDDVARLSAVMTAKILRGESLVAEEEILLDPRTRPFAEVGSSFRRPGEWCSRRGDYDFSLIEYLRLLLLARDVQGSMSDAAQEIVQNKLLTLRGASFDDRFRLPCTGRLISLRDTENHRLMMAVAQYLSNQIFFEESGQDLRYDNRSNGMSKILLQLLREIFSGHFEEYNSRPYQVFSLQALDLLYGYAEEPHIRQAARLLLDYSALWMSLQSIDHRRYAPFRRQPQFRYEPANPEPWEAWRGDGEVMRWAFLTGNFAATQSKTFDTWSSSMLTAAVVRYRLPDSILSLALDKTNNPYFVIGHHRNFESYAAGPGYLLSAGGSFDKQAPPAISELASIPSWLKKQLVSLVGDWSDQQHGWAMPNVLIPAQDKSTRLQDHLRFEGHPDPKQRQNTCIAPGFMCGMSLEIPPSWESCAVKKGNWSFFALDGINCQAKLDLYLAVWRKTCTDRRCKQQSSNGTFGLLELSSERAQWSALQTNALAQGEDFAWNKPFVYRSLQGLTIEATFNPKLGQRALRQLNGLGENFLFAPSLRQGQRLEGLGVQSRDNYLAIDVPALQRSLILDWLHVEHPTVIERNMH